MDAPRLPSAQDVRDAAERIAGRIKRTPLVHARKLSALTGADIWLKLENLQYTGAFKERGALNKLLTMPDEERGRGVIAASAGNHAQGLARHAQSLDVPATIVMPVTTPDVKVRQTRELGAEVVLFGHDFDEAKAKTAELTKERGLIFVHPFDDPDVIAGQGTVAVEMIEDGPDFDAMIIPIGGGGLMAGMALAANDMSPKTDVIGVQAALFPSMANALDGGARDTGGNTLAEGIAVKEAGQLTREIVRDLVREITLVDERILERALSMLMMEQKLLVEGAGAAGLAAILAEPSRYKSKTVGLVLCGGNIDARLLSMILMRDLARSGRLARLRVQLLDMPGQLVKVATIIANQDGNVIDVGHHRTYSDLPAKMTCMDVTIDTQGQDHLDRILKNLRDEGYEVEIAAY
ncbi:threonine ammonia-lyase [Hyphococcus flavus]|uniref:Threonine ammonia-lyase n=1 Tax=Hyphococcus flavus TaxID=1866326 RepID=A0AAF0CC80_9PROT|nr:threonine ammonia-lyase [Hyphococcus flavus]WDI32830.1 threonine ammonia-lyase [Hyphococcus flavus]